MIRRLIVILSGLMLSLQGKAGITNGDTIRADKNDPFHTAVNIPESKRKIPYDIQKTVTSTDNSMVDVNLINTLHGRFSGVLVTGSGGSPGTATTLRIRGTRSILHDNSPLFILDGIPVDNSIFGSSTGGVDVSNRIIDLAPADVESITILKAPIANVLYGIRGANGAVIINTKKGTGSTKRLNISLGYAYLVDRFNKMPEFQKEYAQDRPSGGGLIYRGPETGEGYSWGPRISELEYNGYDYPFDQNGMIVWKGEGNGNPANAYDNIENFFENGSRNNVNLSVYGKLSSLNYLFSTSLLNQKGIVPLTDFERKNLRFYISPLIKPNLVLEVGGQYIRSGSGFRALKGSVIGSIPGTVFRCTPTFDNGNGKKGYDAANDAATFQINDSTERSYRGYFASNPFGSINKSPFTDQVDRFIGNAFLSWGILPGIKLNYRFGIDYWNDKRLYGQDKYVVYEGEYMVFDTISNSFVNHDLLLEYSGKTGNGFSFSSMLGYNFFNSNMNRNQVRGDGFSQPGIFQIENAIHVSSAKERLTTILHGFYGLFQMNYKELVFLNIPLRSDWSTNLPAKYRLSFYAGAGLAWNLSGTIRSMEGIDLKLRASWGRTGQNPLNFLTTQGYDTAIVNGDGYITENRFPFNDVVGLRSEPVEGNSQLEPEHTTGFECGMDMGFWNSRFLISYSFYKNSTRDIILQLPLSSTSGSTSVYQNCGEILNQGHEAVITIVPINKQFHWFSSLNFTAFDNKVIKLSEKIAENEGLPLSGFVSSSSRVIEGHPYGVIYGSSFDRTEKGRLIVDAEGWPLLKSNPYFSPLSNPNPAWYLGWQNRITYKIVSLEFLVDIRQGQHVWNGTQGYTDYYGVSKVTGNQRDDIHYFMGVTDDGNGNYIENSRPVNLFDPNEGVTSAYWTRYGPGDPTENYIQKASWIRLRELSITWSLPDKWIRYFHLNTFSVSLTGRNLWLKTDYEGIDPETNLDTASNGYGIDYNNMPNTRTYGFALNMIY